MPNSSPNAMRIAATAIVLVFTMNALSSVSHGAAWWGASPDCVQKLELQKCPHASAGVGGDSPPPSGPSGVQADNDRDGIGDDYAKAWGDAIGAALHANDDLDGDGLSNLDEYRWGLVPACVTSTHYVIQNCQDYEKAPVTGAGGDDWLDGPEVAYWNDPSNDPSLLIGPLPPNPDPKLPDAGGQVPPLAYQDPDRNLDTDHDGLVNVADADSDNDGLVDGAEIAHGAYPEFADSDCSIQDTRCTPSSATTYHGTRQGSPGTGDGLNDSTELAAWTALSPTAWNTNFDGDGIANNLLDPDSDNDGLLDGEEFLLGASQVRPDVIDTDHDGLKDGDEVAWNVDTDLDGHVNANDPDSDNDGMGDAWEVAHHFNMVDPSDAALDRDGDGLSNLGEFQHGTDPDNMDTDNDRLLDGQEVNTYATNPLKWDTDGDGMPDYFEVQNALNPLDAGDAGQDADHDSFDRNQDGTPEQPWPNLSEYRYGRPANYDESASGPWLLGTKPLDPDSDKDGAQDGYEVYYGTNPLLPADANADQDQDGLNFTEEVRHGTDPGNPDTDGDGLCDGGRAARCFVPGASGGVGNQPGEGDYGSTPYNSDSDGDGIPDGQEAVFWDPGATGQAQDVDADLANGVVDSDSDNDGLVDGDEAHIYHTDLRVTDTDADQLSDGQEAHDYGTNPLLVDTDHDGLQDGAEVRVHHTWPTLADTDGDGLNDGAELNTYGTDPLLRDTDHDQMPDGWEVQEGTQPLADDAAVDIDADGLANVEEFTIGTHPTKADSDGDGMPDAYENRYHLDPSHASAAADADADGLNNLAEYNANTDPTRADTDGDGLADNELLRYGTDPLAMDSDGDGMNDGAELTAWNAVGPAAWAPNYDGDTFPNGLLDADSDNDQLTDREEFQFTHTKAYSADSDGDGLSDHDEVFKYQGQYDPNKFDTDGDGQSDGVEVAMADTNGDFDKDGLKNGDEATYGTDVTKPDTDCDGINDGPEAAYWGPNWNNGGNRLLDKDVDGDTLPDGLEIGAVGTPGQVFTVTLPDRQDTDGDGLADNQEAHSNARVTCGGAQTSSPSSSSSMAAPAPGQPLLTVADNPALRNALLKTIQYRDAAGNVYGMDGNGLYVQGGYGIRLYLNLPTAPALTSPGLAAPMAYSSTTPGSNGKLTDPTLPDTDGDGLLDGAEVTGSQNPFKSGKANANLPDGNTDPLLCDSDHDGLGDGVELGVPPSVPSQGKREAACNQRDWQTWTITDPNKADTDNDGLIDGPTASGRVGEDQNGDGANNLVTDGAGYCGIFGETSADDADSDDDGIADGVELTGSLSGKKTSPFCFDTDHDGLSDGLEQGVRNPLAGTAVGRTVLSIGWPTWQPFQGTTTNGIPVTTPVDDPDADDDGIPDGLEDVNHNGIFGDYASQIGAYELNPKNPDSDGDNVLDGRELLIYSPTVGNTIGANFLDLMQSPGFGFSKMVYNAGNPWATNPRSGDTDGDGAKDGADLNPRADALLGFWIPGFQMNTKPDLDQGADGWNVDLFFDDIKVVLPISDNPFELQMNGAAAVSFPSQNMYPVPNDLIDKARQGTRVSRPSTLGNLWDITQLADDPRVLAFNIPETPPPSADLRDLKVTVTIQAKDYDGCCNPDDRIDLNPANGASSAVFTFVLGEDSLGSLEPNGVQGGYLVAQNAVWDFNGNNENINDEAGHMKIKAGDTVPSVFLQGLEKINQSGKSGLPDGICHGESTCFHG